MKLGGGFWKNIYCNRTKMNKSRKNYNKENKKYARVNRKNPTKCEGLVWHMVLKNKNIGVKFTRQKMI